MDFDVDAASVAQYEVANDGTIPLWSYYARQTTPEEMELSMSFPFPSGNEVLIVESNDSMLLKELFIKYFGTENNPALILLVRNATNWTFIYDERNLRLLKDLISSTNTIQMPVGEAMVDLIEWFNTMFPEWNSQGPDPRQRKLLIESFVLAIKETIDNHNLYLSNLSDSRIEMISKNYDLYKTYKIISDPINYILAYFSVDATTDPLKAIGNASKASNEVKRRAAGDFTNRALSILENQVGKEAIGICAVALKTFFGLTLYNNDVLYDYASLDSLDGKHRQELELRLKRLSLGNAFGKYDETLHRFTEYTEGLGIKIGGKTYYYLANINPNEAFLALIYKQLERALGNDEQMQIIADRVQRLIEACEKEDAALVQSALLSLATDNAKELLLAKLNAGTKTIDMYLYGLAIGMEFDDIANIMMSPLAERLVQLLDNNAFTELKGIFDFLAAIDYYTLGPLDIIKQYDQSLVASDYEGNELDLDKSYKGQLINVFKGLLTNLLTKLAPEVLNPQGMQPYEVLCAFALTGLAIDLETGGYPDKIAILRSLTNPFSGSSSAYFKFNRLIDFAIAYVDDVLNLVYELIKPFEYDSTNRDLNIEDSHQIVKRRSVLYDLELLACGAAEMLAIGRFYGNNQGLPTSLHEILDKVKTFSDTITSRAKIKHRINERRVREKLYQGLSEEDTKTSNAKAVNDYSFDFAEFCLNELYREDLINKYETWKHTFNVLDAVAHAPHFFLYTMLLGTLDKGLSDISLKYKYLKDYGTKLMKRFKITSSKDRQKVYRGLANYASDVTRRQWMLTLPTKLRGNDTMGIHIYIPKGYNYIHDGKIELSEGLFIKLGTPHGDAAFKYYIEKYYIPELKRRFTNNRFVLDLEASIMTNTATLNPILYYTLPCNMLPRTDEEKSIFTAYKADFNNIANLGLNDGNGSILDMMFYYGLIAHYGRLGLQSLMSIFLDWNDPKIVGNTPITLFHAFEAKFTKSENAMRLLTTDNDYEVLPYILSVENPYSSYRSVIMARDPDTMLVSLYYKNHYDPNEWLDDYQHYLNYLHEHGAIGEYTPMRANTIDEEIRNYYMLNDVIIQATDKDSTFTLKNGIGLTYNRENIIELDLTKYMLDNNLTFDLLNDNAKKFIIYNAERHAVLLKTDLIPELKSFNNPGMTKNGVLNQDHIIMLINQLLNSCKV